LRGDQYVNFTNITLKGGTSFTTAGGEYTFEVLPDLESGAIEARINQPILKVPECGQCENCVSKDSNRKLCIKRTEKRKNLIASETRKALKARGRPTTNIKPGVITTSGSSHFVTSTNSSVKSTTKKRKSDSKSSTSSKRSKTSEKPNVKLVKTANGTMKPRVTSQGNKRMCIPEEAFPDLCRRIGAHGTGERKKVIQEFADEHPTTSVRQVTLKLGEITQKTPPPCVDMTGRKIRAFMFYLRPKFYKYLPPDERPKDWEKWAADDEIKWDQEQEEKKRKKSSEEKSNKESEATGSGTDDHESVSSDRADSVSNSNMSLSVAGGDDTDDDERSEPFETPPAKKMKVEETA
jgi:hypothetical protein